jgi:hypothetical protein
MNYILLKELMKQSETECGFDSNKFAELIVAECLTEVVDEVQYATSYELADQVANRVKKHFGVEE